MGCNNNIKGRDLLLEIFDGGAYKVVGGIRTKDFTRDNPVSDVTSQSTGEGGGGETEAAYNGYSTVTLSGNGTVDTRVTASLMAYKALSLIANGTDPSAVFRLSDSLETHEGSFLITSFGKNSEENGIVEFSMALQNCGVISHS